MVKKKHFAEEQGFYQQNKSLGSTNQNRFSLFGPQSGPIRFQLLFREIFERTYPIRNRVTFKAFFTLVVTNHKKLHLFSSCRMQQITLLRNQIVQIGKVIHKGIYKNQWPLASCFKNKENCRYMNKRNKIIKVASFINISFDFFST